MSNKLPLEAIFTIIGVILGFGLFKIDDWYKANTREKKVLKALKTEMTTIHNIILQAKKDKNQVYIPAEEFPFATNIFDLLRAEIASIIKPESLSYIQRVYTQIKKLNSPSIKEDQPTNIYGFMQVIGTSDFLYFKNQILEIDKKILEAIKKLDEKIG